MRSAVEKAIEYRSVFMTPEHLVSAILTLNPIKEAMREFDLNVEPMVGILDRYLMSQDHRVDDDKEYGIDPSAQFESLIMGAIGIMRSSQAPELEVTHVLRAAMNLENSLAGNLIAHYVNSESGLMSEIISKVEEYAQKFPVKGKDVAVNTRAICHRAKNVMLRKTSSMMTSSTMTGVTWICLTTQWLRRATMPS